MCKVYFRRYSSNDWIIDNGQHKSKKQIEKKKKETHALTFVVNTLVKSKKETFGCIYPSIHPFLSICILHLMEFLNSFITQ